MPENVSSSGRFDKGVLETAPNVVQHRISYKESMGDEIDGRREEYERFFIAELRRLLDLDDPVVEVWSKEGGYARVKKGEMHTWKGVAVEEVRLDTSVPEHEAVVLLRDLRRPERLFGWRAPAFEPGAFGEDWAWSSSRVKDAAEIYAVILSANLEEDLSLTNFPRRRACSPGTITWFL